MGLSNPTQFANGLSVARQGSILTPTPVEGQVA